MRPLTGGHARRWAIGLSLVVTALLASGPASGQTGSASGTSGGGFWDRIVVAPGVSYRTDSVTIAEGSDRALFTTAPGEEFESFHLLFTEPTGEPFPYFLEFRSYHLSRQKLIRTGEEDDSSSTPSSVDLGTSIRGIYAMAGVELTAQYPHADTSVDAVGIGLGAGVVSVEGDVRFARKLRESKLQEARSVDSGLLPGVSVDLFAERTFLGAGYGLPEVLHAGRVRLGGGLVFFTDARNQLTAEYLQLLLSVHFAL